MQEVISAADANRSFARLLRGVRQGRSYVITNHGKPIARLIPAVMHDRVATNARLALLSRLEKQPVIGAGNWMRDKLYDD
jgi:prevent-host-death family protein